MTTPAEARPNGHGSARSLRRQEGTRRAEAGSRVEFEFREVPLPGGTRSVPTTATVAVGIGTVAVVGGLVIAALVRPDSPGTVWLVSTLVLACVGGFCSVPALEILERRRAGQK